MRTLTLSILLLAAFALPGLADHPQDANGGTVAFDHVKGNEWWVEVTVDFDGTPDAVSARDTGDATWHALDLKDWGTWGGSFHIEPGHRIMFRAVQDGVEATSCWFTHPDGMEQCEDADAEFDASFSTPGGNEWWVEVYVSANQPLAGVDARANGGSWHALTLRDWGAWAGSFHVPDGSLVEFRAHATSGETEVSGQYRWPSGEPVSDGDEPFDAAFSTPGGNEWWVEVYVSANQPLAGVDARANGGSWHALTLRDWGAWAKSFHVPDGSLVEFRAHATTGETDMSGQYRWPSGELVDGGAQGLDAAFGPKAGNEWWVETFAIAEETIVGVDARANGGSWHALTLREWGAWAGSFHVPDGSVVEFRAHTEGGQRDRSDGFLWPEAVPADDPGAEWPQEGSYLRYEIYHAEPAPRVRDLDATLIHHDGRWLGKCEGTEEDPGGTERFESFVETAPPFGPTPVTPGEEASVGALFVSCKLGGFDVDVTGADTHSAHQEGDPVTIPTWRGERIDQSCLCLSWEAEWAQENGLVVYWDRSGRSTWQGDLIDTDAPVV